MQIQKNTITLGRRVAAPIFITLWLAGCRSTTAPTAPTDTASSAYDYSEPTAAPAPAPAPVAAAPSYSSPSYSAPSYSEPPARVGGESSRGTSECSHGDGYQTVVFSDGSSYSGNFKDCVPLEGPAKFKKGEVELVGHARRGPGGMILKTSTHEVTISLR